MSDMKFAPLSLPRATVHQLRSPVDGAEYAVFLALPDTPAPPDGFPAIITLDANATFFTMVESVRARAHRAGSTGVEPAVVVGIGYPGDGPYDTSRRFYDFTQAHSQTPGRATGGAAAMAELIDIAIKPFLAQHAPVNMERLALFGHSMAGYFVLTRLLLQPDSFQTYLAASPSVWWDQGWLLEQSELLAPRLPVTQPRRLLVSVGEFEQPLAPWQQNIPHADEITRRRQERGMIDRARDFTRQLSRLSGDRLIARFEELPDEDHASSVPTAISHGVRFALWHGAAALKNI